MDSNLQLSWISIQKGARVKRIFFEFLHFIAMLSGALIGIFSTAVLLFALTVNAQNMYPRSAPLPDDDFLRFLENLSYLNNLSVMESQGLNKGSAGFEPWSGSYWPIHKGILGARYASSTFADTKNFLQNYQSYQSHPAENFIMSGAIKQLSPAEKYDLLVGDPEWTLTHEMWAKGLSHYEQSGGVDTWTGICHGWAAAAHLIANPPYSPVEVTNVTGQYKIHFYPNDIKGLLSYLWAESSPNSFRAGNRCREHNVQTDPYLRPLEPACLDTNPMSWHMTIVNRVGLHHTSFVMDSSGRDEVWNYPITGYDYNYFDPKTFVTTHHLKEAIRPLEQISFDTYKGYRSPQTRYVVGIVMDTFHPSLTVPNTGLTNRIVTKKETYIYDLELDENYNIIGGEWYGSDSPDFIWTFPAGSRALTREDVYLSSKSISWSANEQMRPDVAEMARRASKRGQVLTTIAEALLQNSQFTTGTPQDPPNDEGEIDVNLSH